MVNKVWRFKVILMGFLSVLIIGGLTQAAVAKVEPNTLKTTTKVVKVSGEISSIDIKRGTLQLEENASQNRKDPVKYKINKDATRVTDPADIKFLKLEDLRVGQYVTVEFNYTPGELVEEEPVAQKIIATPLSGPVFQEITGELEAIDVQAGTLVVEQKSLPDKGVKGDLFYFVFEPNEIIVMESPSVQPVRLELNPGDRVRVEYVVKDGKRYAHSITLLSPVAETVSTTTTTTTRKTVIR